MTIGLVFQTAAPPVEPAPNRTDIACFIGFVGRRIGAPLPDTVRAELKAAGWIDGPWARSEEELESALQLPIAVESWDAFDALYAWDERPLRQGGDLVCATYLGAAVRSFFARGGRRALIVRVGDPWPYLVADREAQRRQRIRALVPSFADPAAPGALFDVNDPRKWRGIEHLYGLADVSLALLPDLADACATDPAGPALRREPPEPHDLPLEQEDPLLQRDPAVLGRALAEDVVLQVVRAVLEGFDDREVAVDDLVDQHVDGEAGRLQFGLALPSAHHLVVRDGRVEPERHEVALAGERVHLGVADLAALSHTDRTQHDERVVLEELDLRALTALRHVLDRQRMDPELRLEPLEVACGRRGHVEPEEGAGLGGLASARIEIDRFVRPPAVPIQGRGDHPPRA